MALMALPAFRGISTPSLKAQGEQRRSSLFNIPRDISRREGLRSCGRGALSRCQGKNATFHDLSGYQAAATAVRHVVIAAARSARCVWAELRWRWTLKVL